MNKQELINELKEFKNSIQEFHNKRWDYTINIPMEVIENEIKNNSNYQEHDLEKNIQLKKAIYFTESDRISKKRKNEIYNIDKSNLKQQYGKLSQYIQLFSNHPAIENFPCYDGYFLNDLYKLEEKNFASVISDIDIMIGKIEVLNERDFQRILKGNTKNWWKLLHPVWWIYWLCIKAKEHWVVSFLMAIVGGIIWIFIDASLTPMANLVTKPIQDYISGTILPHLNK